MIVWAAHSAIATSILILVVLALRRPVAETFGARAAYALWLAPAARAILPPISLPAIRLPSIPLPVAASTAGPANYSIVTAPAPAVSMLPWIEIATLVWLIGAAAYLTLHWYRHQHIGKNVYRSAPH